MLATKCSTARRWGGKTITTFEWFSLGIHSICVCKHTHTHTHACTQCTALPLGSATVFHSDSAYCPRASLPSLPVISSGISSLQLAKEHRFMRRWLLELQQEGRSRIKKEPGVDRCPTGSPLLLRWKDIVCHNELPLIWASGTVRLSLATRDDKPCLQDHLMRGQGCFGPAFTQLADGAFNAALNKQGNFDYLERSLHLECFRAPPHL